MLHALKHTAVRLWLALLMGVPVVFWVLPGVEARQGVGWTLPTLAVVLLVSFGLVGWIGNRLGKHAILRWLEEGGAWERHGQPQTAAKAFRRAVAVYESYLLSPLTRRRLQGTLVERLAHFYLALPEQDELTAATVSSYLMLRPGDQTVAEKWLRQLDHHADLDRSDQQTVDRIAQVQADHPAVQRLLARRFMDEGRTDFQALETYRLVMQLDPHAAASWARDLAALFLREGRADEGALEIYLKAWSLGNRGELQQGLAACLHWLPENEHNRAHLQEARALLKDISADDLEILSDDFKPPIKRPAVKGPHPAGRVIRAAGRLGQGLARSLAAVAGLSVRTASLAWRSPAVRRVLIWTALAGATAAAAVLLVNTVGHIFKARVAAPPKPEKTYEIVASDRFTIQVAAYLKKEHAKIEVDRLKRQEIDAYWTEARGKSKTWYQVRVSHFPDKSSALAYGDALKSRGLVDDFYVANYRPPDAVQR